MGVAAESEVFEPGSFAEVPGAERWCVPGSPVGARALALAFDPFDPRRFWVGVEVGGVVATEDGDFVEVQGSGEEATFAQSELEQMMLLSRKGIADLISAQRAVLARIMVSPPES